MRTRTAAARHGCDAAQNRPEVSGPEREMMDRGSRTRARRGVIGAVVALLAGLGTVVAAVPASAADEVPAPSLSVSPSTGLNPDGATVTVTGQGFDTSALGLHPPLAGQPAGVYVQIGWLAQDWRPSAGAGSTARTNAYSVWAQGANDASPYLKWTVGEDGTASFSWTVTVTKAALDAKALAGGTLAVFTVGAGGVTQAVNEVAQPITFAERPAVTITDRTVHDDGTLDLTVTGSGFAGAVGGTGIYVALGPKIGDDWYLVAARFQKAVWVHAGVPAETASQAPLAPDGTFTVHLTGITPTFVGGGVTYDQATTPFSVLTLAAHGSQDRSFDTATPVSFAGTPGGEPTTTPTAPATTDPTPPAAPVAASVTGGSGNDAFTPGDPLTLTAGGFAPGETGIRLELHSTPVVLAAGLTADASGVVTAAATIPASTPAGAHTLVLIGASRTVEYAITVAPPACVARSVAGATLTWGVRDSFRSYVTGPIANGAITPSGVSGSGPWTWSGGSGRFNAVDGIGATSWSGGVRFTGHAGALDLTFSAPRIAVTSASAATLSVVVTTPSGSSRVTLATLNLAAGSHSATSSRVSWSGVPATLTAAGAQAFEGFYQPGEALDPVTFALPLGAQVDCDPASGALAATGGGVSGGLVALAAGLLAVGAAMVVVATRRRRPVLATA